MKRLVLFVEGEGDRLAGPKLVRRLLNDLPSELQGKLFADTPAFKVGGIERITGTRSKEFIKHIESAMKQPKLGAILVLLDGDADRVEKKPFCHVAVAKMLAERSRETGAGTLFSLGVAVLRQEFESLLIAVADQLPEFKSVALPANIEDAPRDAKGWLQEHLTNGYRESTDQILLTEAVKDWTPARKLRCFQRLESVLAELARAVETGQHVVSPRPPEPPADEEN